MLKMVAVKMVLPLSFMAALFTLATAGGVPKWVAKIPADAKNLYIVGIKTASPTLEDGKRSAIKQAVAELVEHFGVGSSVVYGEKKTELETKVLDAINTKSDDVRVKGALLKDWYFEKTKDGGYDVYVLIMYPKEELEREKTRIKAEEAEKVFSIKRSLLRGEKASLEGDANGAYLSFIDALKGAADAGDARLRSEAVDRLKNLLQGIEVKPFSGSGQKAEPYKGFKEPFVVKVFLKADGREVPLISAPVLFEFENGDKPVKAITDEKGLAHYTVSGIKVVSGRQKAFARLGAISMFNVPDGISPSDRQIIDSYLDVLAAKSAEFDYESITVKKGLKVLVLIKEENLGAPSEESIVGNELSSSLAEAGYDVIGDHEIGRTNMEKITNALNKEELFPLKREFYSMADIIVTGTVKTGKGSDNMGVAVSVRADGYVRAIDLGSGKVIAQENFTGIVGFGETAELAGLNVLKRISNGIAESLVGKLANSSR